MPKKRAGRKTSASKPINKRRLQSPPNKKNGNKKKEPKKVKAPKKNSIKNLRAERLKIIDEPAGPTHAATLIPVKLDDPYDSFEDEAEKLEYEFKNYFKSESQLDEITYKSDPENILSAYSRLIWVFANNHVREDVELEDLIAEGQLGVCEAIKDFNNPKKKKPNYNFHQACLYKIRSHVFQYCLKNASQIKTPYYIQRGCMHVGQIFKLMANQSVAEKLLKRVGPATEEDIIRFIYDEDERLPKKSMSFIKKQITKKMSEKEFAQILSGILNHELGSRHSYIKNNLTDVGKVLHIKEKMYFSAMSNNMRYARVMDLILSARKSKTELTPQTLTSSEFQVPQTDAEKSAMLREFLERGKLACGEKAFDIFVDNKIFDITYDELAKKYAISKNEVSETINHCLMKMRDEPYFQQMFMEM